MGMSATPQAPVVLLACPLHVLLPRHRRLLGAGLHLSQLSHLRGPAQLHRDIFHWTASAGNPYAASRQPGKAER